MHDVGMSLLLLAGLALLPRYCDIWGHDKKEFEKRRRVYASGWQKWMMTKRNLGRYGSLAVLYAIWICGSAGVWPYESTGLAYALAAAAFVSFLAFQILPDTFYR